MDVQILLQERMSESGSSLPKMIKESSLSHLDLLVRESIQNSLDAALDNSTKSTVEVDFRVGKFESSELNAHLGIISERISRKYPGGKYDFISVSDKKTKGLTGNPHDDEDRSNLQKLVYQISQQQEREGSGGSNGLGKTIFYRVGIGLVIYYSRIFDSDKYRYEHRLVATLVEDERKRALITEDKSRGIAFFGRYVSNNKNSLQEKTIPITDESEIRKILGVFSLEPYTEDTGTIIIAPYVDPKKLLKTASPPRSENDGRRDPEWIGEMSDYLKVSIQRWYAPRLYNHYYEEAWLKASVNGEQLSRGKMHPLFALLQELYNATIPASGGCGQFDGTQIFSEEVRSNFIEGRTAGYIAWTKINTGKLNLKDEYYRNAYALIGDYNAPLKSPIISYSRKPGMIIRYDTQNSNWVPKINGLSDDELLVATFRLASDRRVKKINDSLEEYVRSCEKPDHYDWEDKSGQRIIDKISSVSSGLIQKYYAADNTKESRKKVKLSRMLSDIFLPDSDYTTERISPGGLSGKRHNVKRKASKKASLNELSYRVDSGNIIYDFSIKAGSDDKVVQLYPRISAKNGSLNGTKWEDEMDTLFPLSSSLELLKIDGVTFDLGKADGKVRRTICDVQPIRSTKTGNNHGYSFIFFDGGHTISGTLKIKTSISTVVTELIYEGRPD